MVGGVEIVGVGWKGGLRERGGGGDCGAEEEVGAVCMCVCVFMMGLEVRDVC
jgi:hypothetical protein